MNNQPSALDEVLQDAKEQYGTAGAMAYTVKQAFIELSALRARVAAYETALQKIAKMDAPTFPEAFGRCVDVARAVLNGETK